MFTFIVALLLGFILGRARFIRYGDGTREVSIDLPIVDVFVSVGGNCHLAAIDYQFRLGPVCFGVDITPLA